MSLKDLRRSLLTSYSFQAQHNSTAYTIAARETRLRVNLDKLEAMQKAQKDKSDAN